MDMDHGLSNKQTNKPGLGGPGYGYGLLNKQTNKPGLGVVPLSHFGERKVDLSEPPPSQE